MDRPNSSNMKVFPVAMPKSKKYAATKKKTHQSSSRSSSYSSSSSISGSYDYDQFDSQGESHSGEENNDPLLARDEEAHDDSNSDSSDGHSSSSDDNDGSSESEDEGIDGYKKGGYHPVSIGEVYNDRFVVLEKLGWGHFSTVWRCVDRRNGKHVAMKVQKSAEHYSEAALDEIKLLQAVVQSSSSGHSEHKKGATDPRVVLLLDHFEHTGVNGTHVVMVFEMLGDNLLTLIKYYNYRGAPVDVVRKIARHVLEGLDFLHTQAQIIHTDLKPENILLCEHLPKKEKKRKRKKTAVMKTSDGNQTLEQHQGLQELKDQLLNPDLTSDDRKKLKKKMKMKRMKIKKQQLLHSSSSSSSSLTNQLSLDCHIQPPTSLSIKAMEQNFILPMTKALFCTSSEYAGPCPKDTTIARSVLQQSHVNRKNMMSETFTTIMTLYLEPHTLPSILGSSESSSYYFDVSPLFPETEDLGEFHLSFVGDDQDNDNRNDNVLSDLKSIATHHHDTDMDIDAIPVPFSTLERWQLKINRGSIVKILELLEDAVPELVFLNTHPDNLNNHHDQSLEAASSSSSSFMITGVCLKNQSRQLWKTCHTFPHRVSAIEALDHDDQNEEEKEQPFSVQAKVADLGNACWTYKQFSQDIQTRQYRSPEVILGQKYDTSADMWSLGCIIFELLTGDLLFDPKSGKNYDRNEDHVAQMIELMGNIPKGFATKGKHCRELFTRKGELRHIRKLKVWGMQDVLHEKYRFSNEDAHEIASLLNAMLQFEPSRRWTAAECLEHSWVQ